MKTAKLTFKHLSYPRRLIHLMQGLLGLLLIFLLLVYGVIMATNTLTQFQHASIGLYASIFISCYLLIAVGFVLLFKFMTTGMLLAVTGLMPIK